MSVYYHTDVIVDRIITFLFAVLISCFFIFEMSSWSSRSLIIITVLLLLIYLIWKDAQLRFRVNPFHKHMLAFIAYSFLTAAWSWDASATFSRSFTVLLVFICMAVVYMIYEESGSIEGYLQAIMISGLIVSAYTVFFIGFDNLRLATELSGREDLFANVNAIGMWMAVCSIVFAHKLFNNKFKVWYLLGLIPFGMLAIAQSRTALIEALVGIGLIAAIRARGSKKASRKLSTLIIGALVLALIGYAVTQMDIFSGLYERIRMLFGLSSYKESSLQLRQQMIQIGLRQFKKTPVFGIGIGATGVLTSNYLGHNTYLHNNYVEMIASGGLVGFILYYSMPWYIVKNLWKNRLQDKNVQLALILMLVHLLGDFGTVSFYKKPTYVILALGFLVVSLAKRREANHG